MLLDDSMDISMVFWVIGKGGMINELLTGHGEQNNLLVGPFLGGIVVDRDSAGREFLAVLRPRDVPERRDE